MLAPAIGGILMDIGGIKVLLLAAAIMVASAACLIALFTQVPSAKERIKPLEA